MKFTLFLRCSITDKIHEYKLTADSEETIRELFANAMDTIERIEPGWGDFAAWARNLFGGLGPRFPTYPYHRDFKKWCPAKPYDWREWDDFW